MVMWPRCYVSAESLTVRAIPTYEGSATAAGNRSAASIDDEAAKASACACAFCCILQIEFTKWIKIANECLCLRFLLQRLEHLDLHLSRTRIRGWLPVPDCKSLAS